MTKVVKIKVKNLKAVEQAELNLNGCTAIITGANNSGKSSILRSLPDRIRGQKADKVLKSGTDEGFAEWELSDGNKILWKFDENKESMIFVTKDGFTMKQGVLKTLFEKYFGGISAFDIDKFINSSPKEQKKTLCGLLGIDFTEIDARYKAAYDNRTYKNTKLKDLRGQNLSAPKKPECREIDFLKSEISKVMADNAILLAEWEAENDVNLREITAFNKEQSEIEKTHNAALLELQSIEKIVSIYKDFINLDAMQMHFLSFAKPLDLKVFQKAEKPILQSFTELETELENSQRSTYEYISNLKNYELWKESGIKAKAEADAADVLVKEIETEKQKMIEAAKMPDGFEFTEDGLLYNSFEISKTAQSSSAIYIAGLKLATMNLGELKTVHFDASFLDKKSLLEVEKYANSIGLQLLIERPDFDGGELRYEIISENNQ